MEQEFFRNTRNTNWRPSFSAALHARVRVNVVKKDLDVLSLQFWSLLRVGKDGDGVEGAEEHAADESLWDVRFDTFLNYPPCLVRHPQRLKRAEKYEGRLLRHLTHHVHRALESSDARLDVEIWSLRQL